MKLEHWVIAYLVVAYLLDYLMLFLGWDARSIIFVQVTISLFGSVVWYIWNKRMLKKGG